MKRTTFGKNEAQFFRNRSCPFAHQTSCHAVHVWCTMHTVSQTALYTIICIAVRSFRPTYADGQAQCRKNGVQFLANGPAHLHTPFYLQLQMAFCPEQCFSSRKRLASEVRLANRSSREGLDNLAHLPSQSCFFLMSAEFVAALLAVPFRPWLLCHGFEKFQGSLFCSCVITHFCLSQIPRPVLFHLIVGHSRFALCLCSFTRLA